MPKEKTKPNRIHFLLTNDELEMLNNAAKRLKITTTTDTLRRAIRLIDCVAEVEESGGEIYIKRKDGTTVQVKFI